MSEEQSGQYRRSELIQEMARLYTERPYSDVEMSKALETDRSNIYRIRQQMEEMGMPITPAPDVRGKYYIPRSYRLNHILLKQTEAAALYLAGRRLQQQTRSGQKEVASALQKLSHALGKPLSEKLIRAAAVILEQEQDRQREQVFTTLVECWLNEQRVRIRHRKLHGVLRTYEVSPYQLEPSVWGDSIYLLGYSEYHERLATFKLGRIEHATPALSPFRPPPADFDVHELLQHAWGIWHADGEPVTVRLRFSDYVTPRVRESIWHPQQTIEMLPDGGCIWQAQIAEPQEMLPWLRGWGADVEILEPVALRRQIEREVLKLSRIYQIGGQSIELNEADDDFDDQWAEIFLGDG